MNLKKLNEELDKLISEPINEISDKLKQRVVDARRDQAQKAMDKYARATALANRKVNMNGKQDTSINIDDIDVNRAMDNAEVGDADLFEKIITQDIDETESLGELIINNIDKLSIDALVKILDNYDIYHQTCKEHAGLFPSCWNAEKFGPYPTKLAEALCKSENVESLTDLYNIFYNSRSVKDFSNAAIIFAKDIRSNPERELAFTGTYSTDDILNYMIDVYNELGDKFESVVTVLIKTQEQLTPGAVEKIINNPRVNDDVVELIYDAGLVK